MMLDYKNIVKEHFDKLSPLYDSFSNKKRVKYLTAIDNIIVERFKNIKDMSILDIGCATGLRILHLNNLLNFKQISSCDISEEMVKRAKENGLTNTLLASFLDLPYSDGSFNCVFGLFNVLGYSGNNNELHMAFKEVYRVLKNGGYFIFDVMNYWHLGEGILFRNTIKSIVRESIKSIFTMKTLKSKTFHLEIEDDQLLGYVRGFTKNEIDSMATKVKFKTDLFEILGYDSGQTKQKITQGNFLYILRKE